MPSKVAGPSWYVGWQPPTFVTVSKLGAGSLVTAERLGSASGGVGGADEVSYPTTTPCTPRTFGQLHTPKSVAPAQRGGRGSLTDGAPHSLVLDRCGTRNGMTPRSAGGDEHRAGEQGPRAAIDPLPSPRRGQRISSRTHRWQRLALTAACPVGSPVLASPRLGGQRAPVTISHSWTCSRGRPGAKRRPTPCFQVTAWRPIRPVSTDGTGKPTAGSW
jgi:hypothetical protein